MIVNTCRVFRTRFRKCSIMSSVRQLVTWRKEGHTAVVTLQAGDNRLTPDFLSSFNTVLDAVENDDTIRGLVTTNEGKIYSNGLALQLYANLSLEEMTEINKNVVMLLRRILTFPMVTVAAINGHAFAAGALLSLAHDYRVMRTGRGWFCLPEINIKLLFTMDFLQLAKAKLPPDQYVNCIVYGKRYTAEEAKRVGIIQECCESDKVLETAVELGNSIVSWQEEAFDRNLLAKMKEDLYHDTIKVFTNYPAKHYPKL